MFAILIEDAITEKASVLDTLASDDMAAMIVMITHAENWIAAQPVNFGYTATEHANPHSVTVTAGIDVVLTITAQSIVGVVSCMELRGFLDPKPRIN